MDVEQFSRRMIELLPQCIRGFHSYESNYLSRGQISQPQFWALEYLSRKGDCLMGELAAFLNISRPAATGLIDRLIAQKMVVRRMDQKDRRTVLVGVTPKGKKIVAGIWEQKRRSMVKVFSRISAHDRRQYLDILERVVNTLARKTVCCLAALILVGGTAAYADQAVYPERTMPKVGTVEGLTLKDCYQLALKRSGSLAIHQQQIKEAEGRFLQSLSGVLPKASFNYSNKYVDGDQVPEAKFTFSQPLFSGFKEFAAMAGSKAESRQRRQEEIRARQLLFTDVADAFYYYDLYQEQLKSTQSIAQALSERMAELQKRVDLGRSRTSELASAESRLRKAEADVEQTKSDMTVARELLEFLTGTALEAIEDEASPVFVVKTEQELVDYAGHRPDVTAAQEALAVADRKVAVARAGFWPTVGLEGNYYTKKIIESSSDWDVTLKVAVPLFQGGDNVGKLKESSALAEEAKLTFSETQRKALLDIRQAYSRWEASTRRDEALKKALDAADRNYQLQAADYRNNLVNNLDVLQALADLEDVRRGYISAANDVGRFYWQFKVKTGDIGHDTL